MNYKSTLYSSSYCNTLCCQILYCECMYSIPLLRGCFQIIVKVAKLQMWLSDGEYGICI